MAANKINVEESATPTKAMQSFTNTLAQGTVDAEAVTLVRSDGTETGIASQPVRIDPTGTTTQPVSGTVGVNNFPAVQPVNDNAGSLTTDTGQLPAALDGSGFLKVHEQGTATVDVTDRDARLAGRVKNLDSAGVVIDLALKGQLPAALDGSGFLKTHEQGVAHVDDNAGSLTTDTGQLPAALDGSGFLKVHEQGVAHVDDNGGSLTVDGTVTANAGTGTFNTQDAADLADNAGFTDGTSKVLPAGYIFDEVAGTALTENDVAASRIDSKRAQVLVIEDATTRGRRAVVDANGLLGVSILNPTDIGSNVKVAVQGTADVRSRIWDGTDEATVLPMRTIVGTSEKMINVASIPVRTAGYYGIFGNFSPVINATGGKPGFTLWHPSAATVDVYVLEIGITWMVTTALTGTGRIAGTLWMINADGATGTTGAVNTDISAAASACTFRFNPGTDGTASGQGFVRKHLLGGAAALDTIGHEVNLWKANNINDAIILRSGVAAGVKGNTEVLVAATAGAIEVSWQVKWMEI